MIIKSLLWATSNSNNNNNKLIDYRAYWNFEDHFKTQAASIFSSLDPAQQKHLLAAQAGLNVSI